MSENRTLEEDAWHRPAVVQQPAEVRVVLDGARDGAVGTSGTRNLALRDQPAEVLYGEGPPCGQKLSGCSGDSRTGHTLLHAVEWFVAAQIADGYGRGRVPRSFRPRHAAPAVGDGPPGEVRRQGLHDGRRSAQEPARTPRAGLLRRASRAHPRHPVVGGWLSGARCSRCTPNYATGLTRGSLPLGAAK